MKKSIAILQTNVTNPKARQIRNLLPSYSLIPNGCRRKRIKKTIRKASSASFVGLPFNSNGYFLSRSGANYLLSLDCCTKIRFFAHNYSRDISLRTAEALCYTDKFEFTFLFSHQPPARTPVECSFLFQCIQGKGYPEYRTACGNKVLYRVVSRRERRP